jgi:hypothetical protein
MRKILGTIGATLAIVVVMATSASPASASTAGSGTDRDAETGLDYASALGIGGDGIDQDDLVSRGGSTALLATSAAPASAVNVDAPEFGFDVSAQKTAVTGEMTAGYVVQEHFPPGVPNAEGGPLFGIQFSLASLRCLVPGVAQGRCRAAVTGSRGGR